VNLKFKLDETEVFLFEKINLNSSKGSLADVVGTFEAKNGLGGGVSDRFLNAQDCWVQVTVESERERECVCV
jgi:hypothetical protein